MSNITHEHVQHLHRRGQQLHQRLTALKEKLSGTTARAVRTLEVATAATLAGVIQGKAGPSGATLPVIGVPVDLGAGLLLNLLGYFDAAGDEYSEHLNNFGDGFLAAYLSNLGFSMGNNWRTTGKLLPAKATPALADAAAAPAVSQGDVSPEQMADIIRRVRAAG